MILVVTGMDAFPFDRLVRAVDALAGDGTAGDDFFVQLGASRVTPVHARFERFLSFGDVCERIRAASAVITHAGAGSILVCLQHGKHPVVVPRRPELGEVTDAHQVQLADRLGGIGLVTPVHDVAELAGGIARARAARPPVLASTHRADLTSWLDGYWRATTRGATR